MSSRSKPDYGVASRKRKDRDEALAMMANKHTEPPPPPLKSPSAPAVSKDNNWLLAGYLAHEFLTGGTLLGQKWDPARATANPITPRSTNNVRRGPTGAAADVKGGGGGPTTPVRPQQKIYADVAGLLKSSEGAHIEGVVNPTQLAKWLHS
ncbi:hypothetical protein MKW94_023572 [Papaver nudicaule]|uniref:Embryo sac development arrest 6 n=1 Tax=Papaver nudicaule TaxID=74823 RepID=A0AA41V3V3_PAPNU|nr:hypothetical protein [Papaver nudicaule]